MKTIIVILCVFGFVALAVGCGSTSSSSSTSSTSSSSVVGSWRNLSNTNSTTRLVLDSGGTWTYGSSSGTWTVASIDTSDWTEWEVESYGPTRKLILSGWGASGGSGPIEESDGIINNIWVIYKYTDPDSKISTAQIKFGRI